MDLFDFEIEQPELEFYSTSLDSTHSLPEPHEAHTPLLYESKISSRNNSVVVQEDLIDKLDITHEVLLPLTALPTITTQKLDQQFNYSTVLGSLEENSINQTIVKGTNALKINYQKWLLSTSL